MRTLGPNVPSRQEGFQPAKIARALADLEEEKATTNLLGEPSPQAKAWCPFPNEVALDKRLSAAALVLLALRTTFVGSFVLRVVFLLGAHIVRSGLGRDVIKRAIKEIVAAGFLDRRQVRRLAPISHHAVQFNRD